MMSKIAVIDCGAGNLCSVVQSLQAAAGNEEVAISVGNDPALLKESDRIVLPGVGAFGACRAGLSDAMINALEMEIGRQGKPFLGICVGMQLMADKGYEGGVHNGLGWIGGEVRALERGGLKIPHMGFNDVIVDEVCADHPLFEGLWSGEMPCGRGKSLGDFYFLHTYGFETDNHDHCWASSDYGGAVAAVVGCDNRVGVQFHPEKSQAKGVAFLANFLTWNPSIQT